MQQDNIRPRIGAPECGKNYKPLDGRDGRPVRTLLSHSTGRCAMARCCSGTGGSPTGSVGTEGATETDGSIGHRGWVTSHFIPEVSCPC
jgi:hypothetical protein